MTLFDLRVLTVMALFFFLDNFHFIFLGNPIEETVFKDPKIFYFCWVFCGGKMIHVKAFIFGEPVFQVLAKNDYIEKSS